MSLSRKNDEQWDESKSDDEATHDILASLAIANGFSSALDTSYAQLLSAYQAIVQCMDEGVAEEALQELKKYEMDCKFCLTRLIQSIDQLKSSIDDAQGMEILAKCRSSGDIPGDIP